MHKRIRELVRQAGLDDADFPIENWDNVPLAKFAELIVRECLDIAQDRAAFDGFPPNDVNHIIDEIKLHFGVEE